ncbi:MAG: insulinase family protein [Planctomycetes bacterium]|nr:insulinase family protein [Planctomycetota bacterium]
MHFSRLKPLLACLVLTLLGCPAWAANDTAPQKVATIEGITEYRLPNGLQVLLYPDDSKPTVTVNLTIFVGSRHEGYGETGMAHLLEHMLFKGTPLHPQIPKVLQERGSQFNGTTWVDRTNYYETLPATADNLEFALRLEADRLVNSFVRTEDLLSEMTVVRNEFEAGENSPSNLLTQRMMGVAFDWHNYGKSTIGNRTDIERVPIQRLQAFYKKHYQPDNAMLVVAGKFDERQALKLIEQYFGALPKPTRKLDKTYTEEPPQDGERTVNLRRVGEVGLVGAIYHIPSGGHPDNVRETMLKAAEDVGREGITQAELERAVQKILKRRELAAADTSEIAVDLSNWAAQGDWRLYFLYRDRIEKVTPEDVKHVAEKYLRPNNRTVGIFIPTSAAQRVTIPETPDLAALFDGYKGREEITAGEAFDVSPKNIEFRTTRSTLPEGLQLALLPKKTRGETVHLRLVLRYGTPESLKGYQAAADLLPSLMTRGTKRLSRQQIQDELDRNRAVLMASGDNGVATFSIQTKRQNLPAVLKLLEQVLREPSLPDDELEVLRRQQLAGLEQQLTDPQSLAMVRLRRTVSPYPKDDVRYIPTVEEEIERFKAVEREQIEQLYRDFVSAQAGEAAVVGDFDPKEVTALIGEILEGWKSSQPYARIPRQVFPDVKGGKQQILTPDKANAIYVAGEAFPMKDGDPDYPAVVLGNFVFGAGSLYSRLGNRVREKEGLSYGVGSFVAAESHDPRASITLYAICNPQNAEKVATAIDEELKLLLEKGITEDELELAKSGYLQEQQVSRSEDSRLVSMLADTMFAGRTMDYYADLEEKVRALTPDQVLKAMRKHVDPQRLAVVVAGDFKE